ncbi:MAG: TRAP transporter substrate-binding protein DctP [Telmatospirillum sp.]|nr:TRAP transporter substrate-binding protein DctP [Telmatospirillum sp.]
MRRLLIAAIAFLSTGLAWYMPGHTAEPEITLRIVGGLAGQPVYTAKEAPFWQSRIVAATGGRLKGEISAFDRSGIRPEEMMKLIHLGAMPFGTVQFASVSLFEPMLLGYDLPGLNPDFASLRARAAAFRATIETRLRTQYDIELLAVYTYPAQVMFCAEPFADLSQLAGRRIRASSAAMSHMVEALGALPVRVPFAHIVDSVRRRVVDCVVTGAMSGNILGLHRVTTHISPIAFTFGPMAFVANGTAWRKLPKDLQDIVRAELTKLEAEIWDQSEHDTRDGLACNIGQRSCVAGDRGTMKLVSASATDERRMQDILRDVILPDWIARCGEPCRSAWNETLGVELHMSIP